jgi:hypothetical protein
MISFHIPAASHENLGPNAEGLQYVRAQRIEIWRGTAMIASKYETRP